LLDESNEENRFKTEIKRIEDLFKSSFNKTGKPPATTADFYRIGRTLGRGAFGKVSLCMQKLSQQLVAIKSMKKDADDEVKQRTLQEMTII